MKDIETMVSRDDADNVAKKMIESCPSDTFKYADVCQTFILNFIYNI